MKIASTNLEAGDGIWERSWTFIVNENSYYSVIMNASWQECWFFFYSNGVCVNRSVQCIILESNVHETGCSVNFLGKWNSFRKARDGILVGNIKCHWTGRSMEVQFSVQFRGFSHHESGCSDDPSPSCTIHEMGHSVERIKALKIYYWLGWSVDVCLFILEKGHLSSILRIYMY